MTVVAPAAPYKQPHVTAGEFVLFQTDLGEKRPDVALVLRVCNRSIDVLRLGSFLNKEGIRHISDPELKTHTDLLKDTGGVWRETETTGRLNRVEATVMDLTHQVAELGNRLTEARRERKVPT